MPSVISARVPEKKELSKRKKDLKALEKELADKELLLSTIKGELHLFADRYKRIVGGKCAELDDIKAKVLELAHQLNPDSSEVKSQADFARRQARRSLFDMADEKVNPDISPDIDASFSPSDEIKKLFRETARKIHPDLSNDKKDREKRHILMTQLNEAYEKMDIGKIQNILDKWEDELKPDEDIPLGVQLARILRQIAQVNKRIVEIDDETFELSNSEMYQVQQNMSSDESLSEMAEEIDSQIELIKFRALELSSEVNEL
jgi:archaellum component FlaC